MPGGVKLIVSEPRRVDLRFRFLPGLAIQKCIAEDVAGQYVTGGSMKVRVYYEDTDAAGVVYHSNYLGYMERARTEWLREHGISVAELAKNGSVFPVVRMQIDFKAPAQHDDLLEIRTVPLKAGGSSFTLQQQVLCSQTGKLLVDAVVVLACVSPGLKARRLPPELRQLLTRGLEDVNRL